MSLESLKAIDAERAAVAAQEIRDPAPLPELKSSIVYDMPERIYHADPCDMPSLSQSAAHALVCESPAKVFQEHPKFGNTRKEPTPDMEQGTAFHSLVLGKGSDVVVIDADSFKGKHAQEMAELARSAGKVPLLVAKYEATKQAAEAARKKIEARGFNLDGHSEVSVFWQERATDGTIVQCRARFDHLCANGTTILDLKKCADANPVHLPKHMTDYGYDIQEVAYRRALRAACHDIAGREDFWFLFCEIPAPHLFAPQQCAGTMLAVGESKWQRAIDTWAECLRTGVWPDFASTVRRAEAPSWELNRWMAA